MAKSNIGAEFDLLYLLDGNGWSTCIVSLDHALYSIGPTHIPDNPLQALLDGFTRMLDGDSTSDILWWDEPGRFEWHIERNPEQHDEVAVSISNCVMLDAPKHGRLRDLKFEVQLQAICTIILHQARKLSDLMKMEDFAKTRRDFPHAALHAFEKAYWSRYKH
ncbi:MAG: hypothetical protein JO002_09690 [Burkholderiaceae bacterium]|nr:hypothetical protein [Burkholderiaceae bacterium]